MNSREEDARQVHEAASEIATALGTELMKILPGLTSKYAINSQSFIVAAVQAAIKVGASFSQMSQEVANSRMVGGIHFRFEDERGRDDGIALSKFVFANELRPIPEPGTWILLVSGLFGYLAWRRSGRVS